MTDKPSRGLADVVAASTALSDIDGMRGRLSYRGYDINDLANAATFEEIAYLLQRGSLPDAAELTIYRGELAAGRALPGLVTSNLAEIAASQTPMEALRTLVSLCSADDPDKDSNEPPAGRRKAARLTARQPVLVSAHHAARSQLPLVEPDPQLSLAGNLLLQLTGKPPTQRATQILDTCLVLHADHTMNASTFAARVCAATLSDMHSAVVAALGALKGRLHGGANEHVMRTLESIRQAAASDAAVNAVEPAIKARLASGEKIMGLATASTRPRIRVPRTCAGCPRNLRDPRVMTPGTACRRGWRRSCWRRRVSARTWISTPLLCTAISASRRTCSRRCSR